MSYQVLARKWRPRLFSDVLGQETAVKILTNSVRQQAIHQVYLLTGTRGIGKTTIARIFAKTLNCTTNKLGEPCGICAICTAMDRGDYIDFYEIDAASHSKVEDIRDLLENVIYPPIQGQYKIYLIDEVHMLSNHSFNALLKTLEEPPAHAIFMLATTESKKIPITVLSRCMQLYLHSINDTMLIKHLSYICQQEQISYEHEALALIAKTARGSVRDALSLLDQAIVLGERNITSAQIINMLGYVDTTIIINLLSAIIHKNHQQVIEQLDILHQHQPNYQHILTLLLEMLHQIALAQEFPQLSTTISTQLAKHISPEITQLYYQIVIKGQQDLPYAANPHQGLVMVILRMMAFKPMLHPTSITEVLIDDTSSNTQNIATSGKQQVHDSIGAHNNMQQSPTLSAAPLETTTISIPPTLSALNSNNWQLLINQLPLQGLTKSLAQQATFVSITASSISLSVSSQYQSMLNPKIVAKLEEAISNYFTKIVAISIKIANATDETAPNDADTNKNSHTLLNATTTNQNVQTLAQAFNARIYPPEQM